MREGPKKTVLFGTLSQTMGMWGSKVPNFLVKITIRLFYLFLGLCPKIGVEVQSPKQIHGILSEKLPISSKKTKCSKQPKKQNKLNFYILPSGVPNVRVGWVGTDVWDKVPKKNVFFGHLPSEAD